MRHLPFPEALPGDRGKPWKVGPVMPGQNPGSNLVDHLMFVPLGPTEQERSIRAHELGHAAWTPKTGPDKAAKRNKVSELSLQHAEDLRVNTGLVRCGALEQHKYRMRTDVEILKWAADIKELQANNRPNSALRAAVNFMASSVGSADYPIMEEALSDQSSLFITTMRTIVDGAVTIMVGRHRFRYTSPSRKIPIWKKAVDTARYLDLAIPPDPPPPSGDPVGESGKKYEVHHEFEESVGWGKMAIEEHPRSLNAKLRKLAPRRRSVTQGSHLRQVYRAFTDGACFVHKFKQSGGSILIDCSGSMHWTAEDLHNIITKAPQATIATYQGTVATGTLSIVVKGGKAVKPEFYRPNQGGGNVVDGPALRWLAAQKGPRIWVSDGCVTGKNNRQGPLLFLDVRSTCMQAKILRVACADGVPAVLAAMQNGKTEKALITATSAESAMFLPYENR